MKKRSVLMVGTVILIVVIGALMLRRRSNSLGTVQVGVILPLTGSVAEPGTKALNGLRLAIDKYNQTAENKIHIIIEDSRSDPKSGLSAAQKLINVNGVKVIIGDLMSSVAMAVAPLAEQHKVVLLAPGASTPKFPDMGIYIFRNWASDDYDGRVMAEYIFRTGGFHKGAVAYVNNEYGLGLANAFREQFESLGGQIQLFEGYEQGTTEFRPVVAKIKGDSSIDFVYLPGQPIENGHLVKQIREGAINLKLYANLSVESPEFMRIVGDSGGGIIFTSPAYQPETKTNEGETFRQIYEHTYKTPPDVVAGHGYDAGNILIQALKNCNFVISGLRDSLAGITDFPGVTGTTTFLPNGDVKKDVFIKQLRAGESPKLLKTFDSR